MPKLKLLSSKPGRIVKGRFVSSGRRNPLGDIFSGPSTPKRKRQSLDKLLAIATGDVLPPKVARMYKAAERYAKKHKFYGDPNARVSQEVLRTWERMTERAGDALEKARDEARTRYRRASA